MYTEIAAGYVNFRCYKSLRSNESCNDSVIKIKSHTQKVMTLMTFNTKSNLAFEPNIDKSSILLL